MLGESDRQDEEQGNELRTFYAGILSAEEFEIKKKELLDRM